ncbi:hypothetical protein F5141DRAFT_551753 [Pisolithus sp. B1]|nr:hypothetical protein F5141DRAFT_551753 [Pisolithus sp. B1]
MYMQKWVVGKVDSPDECRKFGHDIVISQSAMGGITSPGALCSARSQKLKHHTSVLWTLEGLPRISCLYHRMKSVRCSGQHGLVFHTLKLGGGKTYNEQLPHWLHMFSAGVYFVVSSVRRARVVSIETQCLCRERVGCLPEDRIHDFFDVSQLIWIMWKAVPCRNALRKAKEGAITHLLECEGMWGYTATDFRLGRAILVEVKEETAA